jgi:predicted O-methyltransferase YrrM
MNPQLDDVEAEVTYLRIRARRPEQVVEVSPFRGWSTSWILRALRDNGAGEVVSFDLVDDALRFVPGELRDRWRLVVGDVRRRLEEMPERIDYLFIDSDHRQAFAEWYIGELMPRLGAGSGASVHDVFHGRGPARGRGEARIVLDWLEQNRIGWFTASRFGPDRISEQLDTVRMRLGLGPPIHTGDHDSMLYFGLDRPIGVKNWRPVARR